MGIHNFSKKNLVAKDSSEKERNNCQRKYFNESN